jgi:hypothetical protein
MNANDRIRKYLQIFFFVTVVLCVGYLYFLQQNKTSDHLNRLMPGGGMQLRKDYYPNGSLRAVGSINGFEKQGKWTYFNQKGEIELVETYENGRLISSEKK